MAAKLKGCADINNSDRIQRLATRYSSPSLVRETAAAFIPCSGDSYRPTWMPHSRYVRVSWMWIRNVFFLPSTSRGLREHCCKALQDTSHRRRRGSAFSVGDVKHWNKPPVSVVTVPSANIFEKRLEKIWTEGFLHLPHGLKEHLDYKRYRTIQYRVGCLPWVSNLIYHHFIKITIFPKVIFFTYRVCLINHPL